MRFYGGLMPFSESFLQKINFLRELRHRIE
jgi:hypothetical protein